MQASPELRTDELKQMVVEASRALAQLDADRLEELALSCQALNRDLPALSAGQRAGLAAQALAVTGEMDTFARVLDATRANLEVIRRLREMRMGHRGYGEAPARGWTVPGSAHGDN